METTTAKRSFDPGELFSDLQQLLALYLARAKDAQVIAEMPAKDAISCAKTTTEMMSALQAGKLAAVDEHTHWPRLESGLIAGGTGICRWHGRPARDSAQPPARRRCHQGFSSIGRVLAQASKPGGAPKTAGYETPPYSPSSLPAIYPPGRDRPTAYSPATRYSLRATSHAIPLADFVAQICQPDDDVDVLEPHQRLVARINRLSDMCEDWYEHRAETGETQNRVQPPIQVFDPEAQTRRAADLEDRRLESLPAELEGRRHPAGNDNLGGAVSRLGVTDCEPALPLPTSSVLPPTGANAPRALKRRRTLYTFGCSLRSNNQQPTLARHSPALRDEGGTNNCGRSAPQSPT